MKHLIEGAGREKFAKTNKDKLTNEAAACQQHFKGYFSISYKIV